MLVGICQVIFRPMAKSKQEYEQCSRWGTDYLSFPGTHEADGNREQNFKSGHATLKSYCCLYRAFNFYFSHINFYFSHINVLD